jgi:hypothetical protein
MMQKYFMNYKVVLLALALLGNSFLMHAQTITDTIFVKHPDVAFHKYDSTAEILFVFNKEFNPSSKKWTLVLDIYGEGQKVKSFTPEWFEGYKKTFYYKINNLKKYMTNRSYLKQVASKEWVKGDVVKNGYWVQLELNLTERMCEGFVVNGLREWNWSEYAKQNIKVREGNYVHDIKDGIWSEWRHSDYQKIGQYKNGLKQGKWKDYVLNREKNKRDMLASMFYVNDTLNGFYKNLNENGNYKNGLRDGKWITMIKKDTFQICYWGKGIPVKAIIYLPTVGYFDPKTHKDIPVPYEAKLVKWGFEDEWNNGEWVFAIPQKEGTSYQCWGITYHDYVCTPYYWLGTCNY